ncbi:hemolysin family protein [Domibacillus enclensis]|uniref:CBS domain-containing protein n=1 Tax=Domibacillus enclensis TaxID=1017273 RepID=A0A1N7BVJ2_9BACI|nr:hemolysin family protein [Domibacillus enclensis]OXS74562.1 ion transporter [Domibacillus enclensis]SIR55330.1 CBS domain-containing protein [Domibacillus enclensis]
MDIWIGLIAVILLALSFTAIRYVKRKESTEPGEPPSRGRSSALLAELSGAEHENHLSLLENRTATEVMVPRTEMVYFEQEDTVRDCISLFRETKFTRYPVADGDKDRIIGFVNFKEVIAEYVTDPVVGSKSIKHFVRPMTRMIDSTPVHELLSKMQADRTQMVMLINEYGGTAGIVTSEDIVEVIVGDLYDEFDVAEPPLIQQIGEVHYIASSKMPVAETAQLLRIEMNDEDVDTLGGWVLTENYDIQPGESIEHNGFLFTVLQMEDHQIRHVEIQRIPEPEADHSSESSAAIVLAEPHNA